MAVGRRSDDVLGPFFGLILVAGMYFGVGGGQTWGYIAAAIGMTAQVVLMILAVRRHPRTPDAD